MQNKITAVTMKSMLNLKLIVTELYQEKNIYQINKNLFRKRMNVTILVSTAMTLE